VRLLGYVYMVHALHADEPITAAQALQLAQELTAAADEHDRLMS
jgi:hypothetical protein